MKKLLTRILILLIIFVVTFLSACSCTLMGRVSQIDKIPVNGDYTFVSGYGVTHNGKDYEFEKNINSALKSNGEKVYSPRYSPATVAYNDGKLYFSYNYYNKSLNNKEWDSDYTRKFCVGYVDINKLSVHFIGFYQQTIRYDATGLIDYQVGNYLVLIQRDGLIEIFDITTAKKIEKLTAEYLADYRYSKKVCVSDCEEIALYQSQTGELLIIDGDGNSTEVVIDFIQPETKYLYGFTDDYLLFYDGESTYAAYDRQAYLLADNETAQAVHDEIDNYDDSPKVEYNGEIYSYSVSDEEIVFKSQEGEEKTVTISTMRKSSKELRQIEEICGGELSFKQVKAANGELYIIARNDESFFGITTSSHVVPPIIFKYDMNGNFVYIGRSSGTFVSAIIKN